MSRTAGPQRAGFKRLCAGVAMATLAVVAPAGAAQASTDAWWDCPDGWFCAWYSTDGAGAMARFRSGAPDLWEFNLDDHVWSVWNRTGAVWCTIGSLRRGAC